MQSYDEVLVFFCLHDCFTSTFIIQEEFPKTIMGVIRRALFYHIRVLTQRLTLAMGVYRMSHWKLMTV